MSIYYMLDQALKKKPVSWVVISKNGSNQENFYKLDDWPLFPFQADSVPQVIDKGMHGEAGV